MNRHIVILFVIVGLTVGLTLYLKKPSIDLIQGDSLKNAVSDNIQPPSSLPLSNQSIKQSKFIHNMANQLQNKHGHEIHQPSVQMIMQDFRDFIKEQYPQDYSYIFRTIVELAFPEYAQAILLLITQMDEYDHWYSQNLLSLNDLDPLSKRGTIWQKRHEIFGDLAETLWQKEIDQAQEKRQTVQQTIEVLNQDTNMAMEERLYILQNTLDELYPGEQTHFTLNKGVIANVYFQLESVQKDLSAMSIEERRAALAKSREQMGFSQTDIEQLAKEDDKKQQRWDNGYQYMSAREQLTQRYEGNIPKEQLDQLRSEYFKHEAPTIKAEEEAGFYRYTRPRLFGSN